MKISKEFQDAKEMLLKQSQGMGGIKLPDHLYQIVRDGLEAGAKYANIAPGVTFCDDEFGSVPVECYTPENIKGKDIILYIHGGGWTTGSAHTTRPIVSALSAALGLRAYTISYRLAPENPYPAGVDDCFFVYKYLVENNVDSNITIIGESAGGNLSLVTTLKAKEAGIKLPSAVVVYSPLTDMTGNITTRTTNKAIDPMIGICDVDKELWEVYTREANPKEYAISPLFGDYTDFPPLKIVVDKGEVLYEDSLLLKEKAIKAGVVVEYQEWEDTLHAFPTILYGLPEAVQVVNETVEFIKKHMK